MSQAIRVTVCIPSIRIRREISVSPKMMVQDLKKCLPTPDCDLVFGGSTLIETVPLDFYSVCDGSFLVALNKSNESADVWVRMTEDNEAFSQRMRTMGNPKVSSEYARLKDLRMTRLSRRPGMLSRIETLCRQQVEVPKRQSSKTIIGEAVAEPSTTALPVFWA